MVYYLISAEFEDYQPLVLNYYCLISAEFEYLHPLILVITTKS